MEKITLSVDGMSCSHCEKSVVTALTDLGVSSVSASADEKKVVVEFDPAKVSLQAIKAEIEETGYTVL